MTVFGKMVTSNWMSITCNDGQDLAMKIPLFNDLGNFMKRYIKYDIKDCIIYNCRNIMNRDMVQDGFLTQDGHLKLGVNETEKTLNIKLYY